MLIEDSNFIFQALEGSPVFSELTADEKRQFADQGALCHYTQDTTVFSADLQGDAFYLIVSGVLEIRLKNKKVRRCSSGKIFGEVAIFDNRTRMGTVYVKEAAILAKFYKDRILGEGYLPAGLRAKVNKALSAQIISYLYDELPVSSKELIMKGESETIEFKGSAHPDHFPKIIRTIAAMMNAQGGTILLGVADSGGLNGIVLNHKQRDALVLSLNRLIHDRLGEYPLTLVIIDAEILDGREIIRIDCEPSTVPVFLTEDGNEELFVRVTKENSRITTLRDCIQFMKSRFS